VTVTGEVYDVRSGKVVADAEVVVGHEKTRTGGDGAYRLVGVGEGPWRLTATGAGYGATVVEKTSPREHATEIWLNIPLLPARGETPAGRDFRAYFFKRAPLYEHGSSFIVARKAPKIPLTVAVKAAGEEAAATAAGALNVANELWGVTLIEARPGVPVEVPNATVDFDAARQLFLLGGDGDARAYLPGGVTDDNLELARAFLRYLLLAGSAQEREIPAAVLREDIGAARDLDAIIAITYRERDEFNYAVFRPRVPAAVSPLVDIYFGVGGYAKHGAYVINGSEGRFPVKYQLGQSSAAVGAAWRGLWGKGGWGFAGIWGTDAEAAANPDNPAAKVILRNYITDFRGGYAWKLRDGVRISPLVGYRWLSVRGEYEPGNPAALTAGFDATSAYDGPEAGAVFNCTLPWFGVGFVADYARVMAGRQYNWLEFGGGAVNRGGAGTYAYMRFYWGPDFKYTYGGLALKFDVPVWR